MKEMLEYIAKKHNLKLVEHVDGWVFEIGESPSLRIWGYTFDINDAVAQEFCRDKAAGGDMLQQHSVPVTPHVLLRRPTSIFSSPEGDWDAIKNKFTAWNKDVILKTNRGTGGANVVRCQSQKEIEVALTKLFMVSDAIIMNPYVEVLEEFRCVMYREELMIMYRKQRPEVTGDGVRTIRQLVMDAYLDTQSELVLRHMNTNYSMMDIPKMGEVCKLQWQHNLGRGATPVLIHKPIQEVVDVSKKAANALGVDFCSVDVIKTNNGYQIMEVNGGVMMKHFSTFSEENFQRAVAIYERVILDKVAI